VEFHSGQAPLPIWVNLQIYSRLVPKQQRQRISHEKGAILFLQTTKWRGDAEQKMNLLRLCSPKIDPDGVIAQEQKGLCRGRKSPFHEFSRNRCPLGICTFGGIRALYKT